ISVGFQRPTMRPQLIYLAGQVSTPYMAAIDVFAIRVVENFSPVGSKGPLFDFAVAGSEEFGRAALRGERVEVLPAVSLAGHDDCVVCGVANYAAAGVVGHVRKRIVGFVATVPDFFCGGGGDIGEPDGPRMRAVRLDEITFGRIARHSGLADKRDA